MSSYENRQIKEGLFIHNGIKEKLLRWSKAKKSSTEDTDQGWTTRKRFLQQLRMKGDLFIKFYLIFLYTTSIQTYIFNA